MEAAVLIARIVGLCYLVVGVGFLLNRKSFLQIMEDFTKNAALMFLAGLTALVTGIAIVLAHPAWTADWTVIITVIGWAALIKGVWMILFPGSVLRFMEIYKTQRAWPAVHVTVALALGVVLTFLGFCAA